MRIPSLLATIAALAVTAVACSGGDDDTSNTTEPSAATTTSTIPTTATAASTTTTTEAATTTTSNAPTSTTEATTSTSEPVDEVQEVTEDFLAMWAAFDAAIRDPAAMALQDELQEWIVDSAETEALELLADYRDRALRARRRDDVPAAIEVEDVAIAGDQAELTVCELNSDELVEIGAAPDGSDAVVDDSITSRRFVAAMRREAERWTVSRITVLDEWVGELTCDPA